jgi:hypothetical protein
MNLYLHPDDLDRTRSLAEANRLIYQADSESLASALNAFLSAVCPTQILGRKGRMK